MEGGGGGGEREEREKDTSNHIKKNPVTNITKNE